MFLPVTQTLLFPDPRPLVERLGAEFFRAAPEAAGVYLMRDSAGTVLYVGKAKNLRQRLRSYRVANPDRMPRRHLRLVRAVARIELQECPDEASALAREAELLRLLRPRFNRAGTWPGTPRFLAWQAQDEGLALAVPEVVEAGWSFHGPLGAGAIVLRATLVRLLWCALHPQRGLAGLPAGWFRSWHREPITLPRQDGLFADFQAAERRLTALFAGGAEDFLGWVRERTSGQASAFELAVRDEDLESLAEFARPRGRPCRM